MDMIRDAAHTKTLAFGIACNRGDVRMKGGSHLRINKRPTVFCAEDQMNQNKRERLRHPQNYKSGLQPSLIVDFNTWGFTPGWYKAAPLALLKTSAASLLFAVALATSGCAQTSHSSTPPAPVAQHKFASQSTAKPTGSKITILVLNAKTNHPIHDEKLNIALKQDQIGSVAMPTDKHGIIEVDATGATIIRILSNMYADCRPRSELYTNYSIADIRSHGITTGNLCSSAHPKPQPGELILFEIPKTYVPQNPEPPRTHLPHSDEYPN